MYVSTIKKVVVFLSFTFGFLYFSFNTAYASTIDEGYLVTASKCSADITDTTHAVFIDNHNILPDNFSVFYNVTRSNSLSLVSAFSSCTYNYDTYVSLTLDTNIPSQTAGDHYIINDSTGFEATPTPLPFISNPQYIEVASNSALAKGLHDIFFVVWFIGALIAFYIGFKIAVWIYRR